LYGVVAFCSGREAVFHGAASMSQTFQLRAGRRLSHDGNQPASILNARGATSTRAFNLAMLPA
jgi:hypothetical protein